MVTASLCFAMMEIEQVTQQRAKELGMEVVAKRAGPDLRVKDFVEWEMVR